MSVGIVGTVGTVGMWCGVGGLVLALVAGAAAPAGADQIDDLRNAVTDARAAADAATQRYTEAENHLEALGIEIDSLQREIDTNRERVASLKAIARDRAVTAYKRRGVDVGSFSVRDPLVRVRREKMLQETNARDSAAVNKLESLNDALADREQELHDLREQARAARDRLAVEQSDLEAQLRASQQALGAFE